MRPKYIHNSGKKKRGVNESKCFARLSTEGGRMNPDFMTYLLMLWHMRGMSLARNMSDSQCGDSLLVTPHT